MVAVGAWGEPMTPTLAGRIETRLVVLALIGSLTTLIITPLLGTPGPLSSTYRDTFSLLGAVFVLGLGWELLYHLLQQFRWEKDWPTLFGLITGVNEGIVLWLAVTARLLPVAGNVPVAAFVEDFAAVWVASWLFANGPLRVVFPRWRFRGGQIW